jgi:carbon monoxide dehydrogenase subunit G
MDFSGEELIKAPRQKVWDFLIDPHQATQCAPGLQSVEVIDDTRFKCTVRAGVGMIRGNFNFDVNWSSLDAPNHAEMVANGNAAGSAVQMTNTLDLEDAGEGETLMKWSANVRISGKLAGVGGRLINPVADRMTKDIFGCIRSKLEENNPE